MIEIWICPQQMLEPIKQSQPSLTLYHTIPTFNDPERGYIFLKTFWEKEKMLVTSIFLFSQNVYLPFPKHMLKFESHLFCHLQGL